ncbi:hypothetical protein [Geodermatophilus sp. CPCC 205761]|uniref:hypothetical protein n=1 Tax=Geodermatophilus sp. CPCC 205761 TaxID=2936597 RepID=UPI003EEB2468
MAVQDDVAAVAFAVETELGPAQIREAGRRAAEAGRRYMRTTISESHATRSGVRYVAYGPGGFVRQMALQVSWEEAGAVRRRVWLSVGDHLVERARLLGIPLGRATVPALWSARRFAAALRSELIGAPPPERGSDGPAAPTSWPPGGTELRTVTVSAARAAQARSRKRHGPGVVDLVVLR